jgi:hypothetical protein
VNESMQTLQDTTPDYNGAQHPGISRRQMLFGSAAAIGAGLVIAACGDDSGSKTTTAASTATSAGASPTTAASGGASGDLKIAQLAAGLEVLAVGTYKAALDAATAGKLGAVPPAVATFVQTAMAQHQQQLEKWNSVITAGGGTAVTAPNATLKPTVDSEFAKVTDVTGAAKLALQLEQIAAATYLNAISALSSKDAITLAGSIQIIDMQHAAILNFVLGNYPVPDTFAKTDLAAKS